MNASLKVCLKCEDRRLGEVLEKYLKEFALVVGEEEAEFCISDVECISSKPLCIVGFASRAHIKRPLSKDSLRDGIINFYHLIKNVPTMEGVIEPEDEVYEVGEMEQIRQTIKEEEQEEMKEGKCLMQDLELKIDQLLKELKINLIKILNNEN